MPRAGYIAAWIVATVGTVAMVLIIAHGFIHGVFREEGKWLIDHPWGRVTLVDLYLGFILFSGWVIQRERNIVASVIWVIALMMWGHLAGAVYVIKALIQSKGDRNYFWLGDKPEPAEADARPGA